MPTMQEYEVEVEVTVTVRNTSASRSGGAKTVMQYSTTHVEKANSYSPPFSIPAALTRCIDALHKKVASVARITKDHETARLR